MKKFLENNKIYFEIFSTFFLGLMAIIVSFTQWRTSNQEFELHRSENMPLFKIRYELVKIDSTDKYGTEILKVSNEGKQVKKFQKEFFSFYLFNIEEAGWPRHKRKVYVPVVDFFGVSYNTENLSGRLFESFSNGNLINIINVEKYCQTLLSKKDVVVYPSRQVYFKFEFTSISNEKYTVYMDTYGNDITQDEYDKMLEKIHSFKFGMTTMSDVTNEFVDKLTITEK